MRNTINYNLKLPEGPDKYNISDFNENTEKIDGELKKHADYIADRYNKTEIDNKFSMHEMNIDWKESVDTFNDIAVAYPAPESGWTVNVKDTNYTYRYDGTDWIAISSNAIPKATQAVDGLMSKEQAAVLNKLDQAVGSLQNLTTSEKQSLVGAVNEVKSEVIQLNADLSNMALDLNIIKESLPSKTLPKDKKIIDSLDALKGNFIFYLNSYDNYGGCDVPGKENYFGIVFAAGAAYSQLICMGNLTGNLYTRVKINGSWSGWYTK